MDSEPHSHEWHNLLLDGSSFWWACKCGARYDATTTGYKYPPDGTVYVTARGEPERAEALREQQI